ncbi:MAG TPA: VIT1/CCC1 transporter family protein [Candidatus Binatia bacterium]|nr:VIT1/CCC1 transporter family protein [Candidatus Binatia bacterium]
MNRSLMASRSVEGGSAAATGAVTGTADEETGALRDRLAALLRDVILGGQDGLVNVLGLVLGMAAATGDSRLVLTAGLAALMAESIAMAGVAYTSTGAERAWLARQSERFRTLAVRRALDRRRAREEALHGEHWPVPVIEIAGRIADEEGAAWLAELEAARRTLAPVREARPAVAALVVGLSTATGSAVPLLPFVVLPPAPAAWVALAAGGVVLFAAGAVRARTVGGGVARAGAEMVLIGLASAAAGYLIGLVLRAPTVG